MDTLLVSTAALALVLAAIMSVVAWKLLRESRGRSAARVAALEALALEAESGDEHADGIDTMRRTPQPSRTMARPAAAEPEPAYEFDALDDVADEPSWDGALHPDSYADVADVASVADVDVPARPEIHVRRAARRAAPVAPPRGSGRYAPISVPDGMFNQGQERGAPKRRWAVLAGVAAIVVSIAGTGYAMRGTDVFSRISMPNLRPISGARTAEAPLELLSLRHVTDGAAFTITGLVQNPATGSIVDQVVAVVYLFDKQGRYFASGRAALTPGALVPGAESPFEISIPDAGAVGRYRVGFRLESGAVVAHVDRRGHEPGGTTGDAIETLDRGGAPAISAVPLGRVEGD